MSNRFDIDQSQFRVRGRTPKPALETLSIVIEVHGLLPKISNEVLSSLKVRAGRRDISINELDAHPLYPVYSLLAPVRVLTDFRDGAGVNLEMWWLSATIS